MHTTQAGCRKNSKDTLEHSDNKRFCCSRVPKFAILPAGSSYGRAAPSLPEELAALFRRLDSLIAEARTLQEQISSRLAHRSPAGSARSHRPARTSAPRAKNKRFLVPGSWFRVCGSRFRVRWTRPACWCSSTARSRALATVPAQDVRAARRVLKLLAGALGAETGR